MKTKTMKTKTMKTKTMKTKTMKTKTMKTATTDKHVAAMTRGASRSVGCQIGADMPNLNTDRALKALVTTVMTEGHAEKIAIIVPVTSVLRVAVQVLDGEVRAADMVLVVASVIGVAEITVIDLVDSVLPVAAQVSNGVGRAVDIVLVAASLISAAAIMVIVPADSVLPVVARVLDGAGRAANMVLVAASMIGAAAITAIDPVDSVLRVTAQVSDKPQATPGLRQEWDRSHIRHRSNSSTHWIPTKTARSARKSS